MLTKDDYRRIALRIVKYGMNWLLINSMSAEEEFSKLRKNIEKLAEYLNQEDQVLNPNQMIT